MKLIEKIKSLAGEYSNEIIKIRRHLHANPELSFQEFKTSEYISSKLEEYGIPHKTGFVGTGIVGMIKGKNPGKKVIALRGDIDALPIHEANEVEYKSNSKGVMHACGHDVHASSLLGVAKILNEIKDEFEGTVKLLFQPGEEKLPGGASLMIKEGALKNPEPKSIIGQHVFPELEVGKVGFRSGMYMASADELYVTVKGKGGHAALPHKTVDPILISSHIIVALQQIVSRKAPPIIPSVLSFGKMHAEGATNIIPSEVKIEGTFRTFDEEWRKEAHNQMKSIAENMARGMGGECDFKIDVGYPFLVNDDEVTRNLRASAEEYLGKENVVDLDLRMTAEDFAYFSQQAPSCFYRLGVKNEKKGITSNLHTPTFNIDEDAIELSIGLMSWLALNELDS